MADAQRMQQVHLVLFVLTSTLFACVGWLEASAAVPAEAVPVAGAVPMIHLGIAVAAGQGRKWAALASKLTGVYYLARLSLRAPKATPADA